MIATTAPLAILAVLEAVLALAAWSAGAPSNGSATKIGENVGLRVGIPGHVELSVERSCPPPALLGCGPGLRITTRAPERRSEALEAHVATVLTLGLRAAGFRNLRRRADHGRNPSGRVTSRGEVLGRWRLVDGVVEVTAGGLDLRSPRASRSQLRSVAGVAVNQPVLDALVR